MLVWKIIFLLQRCILRFHAKIRGCANWAMSRSAGWMICRVQLFPLVAAHLATTKSASSKGGVQYIDLWASSAKKLAKASPPFRGQREQTKGQSGPGWIRATTESCQDLDGFAKSYAALSGVALHHLAKSQLPQEPALRWALCFSGIERLGSDSLCVISARDDHTNTWDVSKRHLATAAGCRLAVWFPKRPGLRQAVFLIFGCCQLAWSGAGLKEWG